MQVDIGDVPWMQHVVSCAAIRSRENVTPTFEPQLIGKHEGRFTGFDDKIVAMYAHGCTQNSCSLRCPSNFVFQRVALMPPGIAEQHAC